MAYVALNGYDVEHASSKIVYENLFPEIQHINGKGVTDKYTPRADVENVTMIDVMRVLPYAPRFRKLGATNNGAFHNAKNVGGYGNAPQSTHYTINVDLVYDEGVAITRTQAETNQVEIESIVMNQIVKAAGMAINVITYAKQLEGFFRDSFTEYTENAGTKVTGATATELADSVFTCDTAVAANAEGSYADAFIGANAKLTDGVPEIGAFIVPADARQAFVTANFDRVMKRQYMSNASEAAAKILANGFINPFTGTETTRINVNTGLVGMYDGVGLFLWNNVIRKFTYVALGVSSNATVTALLDKIQAIVVYGAGTVRGIVGPDIQANPNAYFGGVYLLPHLKVGVEVLDGRTIKLVVDGSSSSAWDTDDIDTITQAIDFTPIDGVSVTGNSVLGSGVFNDGTTN